MKTVSYSSLFDPIMEIFGKEELEKLETNMVFIMDSIKPVPELEDNSPNIDRDDYLNAEKLKALLSFCNFKDSRKIIQDLMEKI